ncbi:hypothetical protein FB567DRAFT_554309 [Paraphoma chrysanthemicola]|uniref:Uncharacterized protein n=1 Tax=Paraphoma chrysanthemicola TaxID=798071 RepID=A0A8K0VTF3_9PLEO|nr:hypothetical protein FB567DRAFT_554309 [Paraphoma chrysanthemicola]
MCTAGWTGTWACVMGCVEHSAQSSMSRLCPEGSGPSPTHLEGAVVPCLRFTHASYAVRVLVAPRMPPAQCTCLNRKPSQSHHVQPATTQMRDDMLPCQDCPAISMTARSLSAPCAHAIQAHAEVRPRAACCSFRCIGAYAHRVRPGLWMRK